MVWKAFIIAVLSLSCAVGQTSRCQLPKAINQIVAHHWEDWSLLQVSDLRSDDQILWQKRWGDACPGMVKGHFVSPGAVSYVFSLIELKGHKQQVVLAVPTSDGKFKVQVLSSPSRVAGFAVLSRLPPGKYREVEGGRTMRTKLDSIAYETIEAGMEMFYYRNGSFHFMLLSE